MLPPTNRGWLGFSHRWLRSYTAPNPVETMIVGYDQADGEIEAALQGTAPAPGVGLWATLGLFNADDHDMWIDRIESADLFAAGGTMIRVEVMPPPAALPVRTLRAIMPTALLFAGSSIGAPAWIQLTLPATFAAPGLLVPHGHGFMVSHLVANTAFSAAIYFREAA